MMMEQCLIKPEDLVHDPSMEDGCVADFGKLIEEGQIELATRKLDAKVRKHKRLLKTGSLTEANRRVLMGNIVWDHVCCIVYCSQYNTIRAFSMR